jgi:hypothetical protein
MCLYHLFLGLAYFAPRRAQNQLAEKILKGSERLFSRDFFEDPFKIKRLVKA